MRLKRAFPFFELLLIPLFAFLLIKSLLLPAKGFLYILPGFHLSVLISIVFLINRNFRSLRIAETLKISGFFLGRRELKFSEIKGFRLKETGGTKYLTGDYNLILVNMNGQEIISLKQRDYNARKWSDFLAELNYLGISFLGHD